MFDLAEAEAFLKQIDTVRKEESRQIKAEARAAVEKERREVRLLVLEAEVLTKHLKKEF